MSNAIEAVPVITSQAIDAIAYERAPRYPGRQVNRRVVCADGFAVSIQASRMHYANDCGAPNAGDEWPPGNAPYWRSEEADVVYPFTTFEVGAVDGADMSLLEEWDSDGVWAWVPRDAVVALLDSHGGAVAWESA